MFQKIAVTLYFRDRLYGGLPRSTKVLNSYLEAKFGVLPDDFADRLASEVASQDFAEKEELATTGFKRDEHGLYLSDYQIKAMLKQCATLLKITTAVRGSRQVFHEGLVIRPVKLYLGRQEPDGVEEFCGHVMTMQGKRSVLRQGEYVERVSMEMEVWVLDTKVVSIDHLRQCFELGQEVGLGSYRSFEKGKFDVVTFEEQNTHHSTE